MKIFGGEKLKLTFYGGVGSVTGANFMLESQKEKILIDCGLYQDEEVTSLRNEDFKYDPSLVNFLLITHSHADHIGRIPQLVKAGFVGTIYSTPETKEISVLMLEDAFNLMMRRANENKSEPVYSKEDVVKAVSLWKTIPYHQNFDLGDGFGVYFKDAGHILGSAIIEISKNSKKIAFSGDLGNSPTPFLRDTEFVTDADYLLIESVYGDKNHEDRELRREKLKEVIKDTVKKEGTLLIPAFSVDRTQILLYEINSMVENKEIPAVPVFLDSPLGIRVTNIYRSMQDNLKDETKKIISKGDDVFDFPNLNKTESREESEGIEKVKGPKIIIASGGMSIGGRILFHEEKYLPEEKNTILFIGFQAAGSLGRMIQDGLKEVKINKSKVKVKAKIETITGYSGHKDSEGLLNFIEKAGEKGKLKKVFVAMGETHSSMFLVQRIKDYLDIDAVSPTEGESFELEF
jgi:metallo-beta-lactamase family protein